MTVTHSERLAIVTVVRLDNRFPTGLIKTAAQKYIHTDVHRPNQNGTDKIYTRLA